MPAEAEAMVLMAILVAVAGYFLLALPVAVVIGRSLGEPRDPYGVEPAVAYPAARQPASLSG